MLVTATKNLTSHIHGAPQAHLNALNLSVEAEEMWVPPKDVEKDLGRKYKPNDIFDLLYDAHAKGNSTVQKMVRDPHQVVDFSNKDGISKKEKFYWRNESETDEVINIIAMKGIQQFMSITTKEGQNSLRLCTNDMAHCFKARIVMITGDLPGFRFSSYQYVTQWPGGPDIVISTEQYRYIMEKLTGEKIKEKEIANQFITIKLRKGKLDSMSSTERLKFISEISAAVAHQSRTIIINFKDMTEKFAESLQTSVIFLGLVTILLLALTFFQLVLSIEGNLKSNMWQMGVLRAMGMTQGDVRTLVLVEATANIFAAMLYGVAMGWFNVVLSAKVTQLMQEMESDINFDWITIAALVVISSTIVFLGTLIGVQVINRKKIASILKGN